MRQNPCRYCALADERKGKHLPRFWDEKCAKCEYNKKHKEYLKSQRKFEIGEPIKDLQELLEQTYVFAGCADVPKHIEAIKCWQLRSIMRILESGHFYKAIRKNMEVENNE